MTGQVQVVFFASLRETTGEASLQLVATDLDALLAQLRARYSQDVFAELTAENVRIAINQELLDEEYSAAQVQLAAGNEVAFLPPVTGG